MPTSRNMFVIRPPDEVGPSKYLLLIYRPSGGSMFGAKPTIVGVETFAHAPAEDGKGPGEYVGYDVDGNMVVSFPDSTPYLLLRSDRVETMTAVEAATRQKEEEDAIRVVLGEEEEDRATSPGAAFPGQYA